VTGAQSPHAANGAVVRLTGADRQDGPTRCDTGAHAGRVGAILRQLAAAREREAELLRDLALDLENRLAVLGDMSVMDAMRATNSMAPQDDPLLRVKDVAERLRVDERTVRRMRERGELPLAIDLGSTIRWRQSVIEEWLQEREEAAP